MKTIVQSIPAFRRVQVGVLMLAGMVLFGTLGYVLIGRLIYDESWCCVSLDLKGSSAPPCFPEMWEGESVRG